MDTTAPPAGGSAAAPSTPNTATTATITKREPISYAVYRATGDDVKKEGIASQLNKIGVAVAHTELEARWKVVDASPELSEIVTRDDDDESVLFLVAIPESRVGTKRTTIDRKTSERRI